jgi:type IV pilus biogenesis protein PilP
MHHPMSTPNTKYAVELSNDGVSLWNRDEDQSWNLLGKVALSAQNFSDDIQKLKSGQPHNGEGKLIAEIRIPNTEVYASDIDMEGATGTAATPVVHKFLARNTPYAAKDLIFDLENKDGDNIAYVAAITKQTIAEAKEFILGYGFEAAYYTTKLDKSDFPRPPRFYDGDKTSVSALPPTAPKATPGKPATPADISVPPPPSKPAVKTASPNTSPPPANVGTPLAAFDKADLSAFETVRSKSIITPAKTGGKTAPVIAKSPSPPVQRRISIEVPEPVEKPQKINGETKPVTTKPVTPVSGPIKTPQGDAVEKTTGGMFKSRNILIVAVLILLGLLYWFFTALFDGKEEIALLQNIPATEPAIVAQPQVLDYQTTLDAGPSLQLRTKVEDVQTQGLNTPEPLAKPEPVIAAEDATNALAGLIKPSENTGTLEAALAQQKQIIETLQQAPKAVETALENSAAAQDPVVAALTTKPIPKPITILPTVPAQPTESAGEATPEAVAEPLLPTKEGTPGAEGITLFSGQPDILPPRREQLKISPDPLKDILPRMRTKQFEQDRKAEVASEEIKTELVQTDAVLPDPVAAPVTSETTAPAASQTPVSGDLLAQADPALKSKRPKPRPTTIARMAQEERKSALLLASADPTLANSKPRRRPAGLAKPPRVVELDKVAVNEINAAILQAVKDVARPRVRPKSLRNTVAKAKAQPKAAKVQTASLTPAIARGTSKPSTKASPANIQKEATENAGFSKRRMSLIGVYGTSSSRRALVRMPSGRYVKVKRGQNISGWKVSAIGEKTVRITKGSRNQVLRLPK